MTEVLIDDFHEALRRYFCYGVMPGSFLEAVLRNDLRGAILAGSLPSRARIPDLLAWLDENSPWDSWGSSEMVDSYVARIRELRAEASAHGNRDAGS